MYANFGLDFFTSKKMVNGEHSGCWGLTVFSIEVIAREVNAIECEHWKALKHIIMNTGKTIQILYTSPQFWRFIYVGNFKIALRPNLGIASFLSAFPKGGASKKKSLRGRWPC